MALLGTADAQPASARTVPLPPVSRAEALSTLLHARLETLPIIVPTPTYADVRADAWYADVMAVAVRYGIVTPDASGKLRPEESVNRAQFLKMIALTFGLKLDLAHRYTDVTADDWFAPYAGIAQVYQLFPDATTMLQPQKVVTRPEAAAITAFLLRDRTEDENVKQERTLAAAQAAEKLQLYLTMSTQRQRVKMVWPQEESSTVRTVLPKGRASLEDVRQEILVLTNRARTEAGLPALRVHPLLEESAQTYAREMAVGGFFSHVAPSGSTLRDRVSSYYALREDPGCLCIRGIAVGENLGRGQTSAEEVVSDWLKSPSHRKTMLTSEYTDIGIGMSAGYWVQHFGGFLTETELIIDN